MALINIFKKKSETAKNDLKKEKQPLKEKGAGLVKEKKEIKTKATKVVKQAPKKEVLKDKKSEVKVVTKEKRPNQAWRVLEAGHITEKAAIQAESGKYIFKVFPKATKTEIKKAVESLFGVNVVKVNVTHIPRKRKRLGRTEGWKKGYKKATLTLIKGQTIELLPR